MKVFVAASSSFWDKLPAIKKKLEKLGHEVMLPSTVEDPEPLVGSGGVHSTVRTP